MTRGLAFRRSMAEKKKAKARRRALRREIRFGFEDSSPKRIGKDARTPHPCSCDMCTNQRRNRWASSKERLTIQERKADDTFRRL